MYFATPSEFLYPQIDQVQSSHLLGHFTSNCCGCLDTRLMMQPGLEIILMSLLIRKNSKIANFHCPYNTKYTQKISIHSDSAVGQKYLSRLIIKILFPTVRSQENTFIISIFVTPSGLWSQSCLTRGGWSVVRTSCVDSGGFMSTIYEVRWVRWSLV